MRVPRVRLPEDPRARHARLRDYFCDRDAEAVADGDGWLLNLYWPDDRDRHVDPSLADHLASWGCGLGGMAHAVRRHGRVTTALYDTWTLVSWSRWAAASGIDSAAPLTILHVDDHRDLMSPRLFLQDGAWLDPIRGAPVRVEDPASVQDALESGAIGMGSFLTPFLHAFPLAEVRHLCQPPKAHGTRDFRIELGIKADDLLDPEMMRPSVNLLPAEGSGPSHYRLTTSHDAWLDQIGSGPVLLHIDMDYFNNRFDGDGDWGDHAERLDPDPDEVTAEIRRMADALRAGELLPRIADAVVAYSPGFFPSELWDEAERTLRDSLGELYA